MNSFNTSILILLFVFAFQGCSTQYYGYSKEDWIELSDQEQASIKAEYQDIVDSKREQGHKDVIDARTQSIIDRGVEGPK